MTMKIKFGGSGDISTKKLEGAIEQIIQARTARTGLTIDSNLVICLIQEVLENRDPMYVSEFIVDAPSDEEEEEGEEEEEEEAELRRPVVPKKRKGLTNFSSESYWLESKGARVAAGILLLILIGAPLLMIL